MRLHVFEAEQRFPVAVGELWDFFSRPRNLAKITPPWMRLEFTSPVPDRMYPGLLVGYRLRPLFGIPLRWVQEITEIDEPHRFADEQRRGPYRFFRHEHLFRTIPGGVEMRDVAHYALPRGGGWARRWLVAPRLREIFAYRREVLEKTFGVWTGD